MLEYIELGCSPAQEDCVQVGHEDYHRLARAECMRYLELIRKYCGEEPPGARLAIKLFPHDFGSYYEVICYYETNSEEAMDYAFDLEANAPAYWD